MLKIDSVGALGGAICFIGCAAACLLLGGSGVFLGSAGYFIG